MVSTIVFILGGEYEHPYKKTHHQSSGLFAAGCYSGSRRDPLFVLGSLFPNRIEYSNLNAYRYSHTTFAIPNHHRDIDCHHNG
jgi:hypothetical protein